jgi:hypothetical protein
MVLRWPEDDKNMDFMLFIPCIGTQLLQQKNRPDAHPLQFNFTNYFLNVSSLGGPSSESEL